MQTLRDVCLPHVHAFASLISSSGSNEYQFSFDVKLSLTLLASFCVYIMCSLLTLCIEGDKSEDIFMISRIKLSFFDSYGIICVCAFLIYDDDDDDIHYLYKRTHFVCTIASFFCLTSFDTVTFALDLLMLRALFLCVV